MHQVVKFQNGYYNCRRLTEKLKKDYKSFQQKDFLLEFLKEKIKTLINNYKKWKKFGKEKKNDNKKDKRNKKHREVNSNNKVNGFKLDYIKSKAFEKFILLSD